MRSRSAAFLKQTNTTFSNFIDSKLFLENMLGADRLPLTLLVDAQGRVLGKFYGAKQWDGPEALAIIAKAFDVKLQPEYQPVLLIKNGSSPMTAGASSY